MAGAHQPVRALKRDQVAGRALLNRHQARCTRPSTRSLNSIAAVTASAGGAPLQADRTVSSAGYGAEFHVWPPAAAGAWLLLAEHKPTVALFPGFS
jgi:hypothetical protein